MDTYTNAENQKLRRSISERCHHPATGVAAEPEIATHKPGEILNISRLKAVMSNKNKLLKAKTGRQIEGNSVRNEMLLNLPSSEWDAVLAELTFVELRTHDVLEESQQPIKYVYFLNGGIASILNLTEDGKSVEVGISGKEGCTALPIAAGLKSSANRIVIQVAGTAFRMRTQSLANILPHCPLLHRRMHQYTHMMGMQSAQVAVCNRIHEVDERLARWLLMSQDRIEIDVIPLTHEFLAHMLGTRRSSVTVAAGLLQRAGIITYNRGSVKIVDRQRLEDAACECYEQIVRHTSTWKKEAL